MKLALKDIRIDGGTQPRLEINDDLVSEYAAAMRDGAEFPAVTVFYDGVSYWLADGFHRTHAARHAQLADLTAEIHSGTKRDAVLYSVGANAAHGQRRTNSDKRKAVMTLLEDEEWSQWADREIARQCAVSDRFVNKMRSEIVTANGSQYEKSSPRTFTHHKTGKPTTMDTSKIGRRSNTDVRANILDMLSDPDLSALSNAEIGKRAGVHPKTVADAREAVSIEKKPTRRGIGLRHAHEAIAALRKIPIKDGLRQEAFDTVSKWIEDNRSNA